MGTEAAWAGSGGSRWNPSFFFFFFLIYFWLRCVFAAVHGLFSSCGERGLLFVAVRGLLIGWLLLLESTGSRRVGQ